MYNGIEMSLTGSPIHLKKKISSDKNIHKQSSLIKNNYNTIIKKNIFKVISNRKNKALENQDESSEDIAVLKATKLKLKLLGTVAGGNLEDAFAVIEDKIKKEQSLYQIGQSVQGAKVIKILRQKVVLNYNGEDQVLEMDILPDLNAAGKRD
ncbi:MAG: hypothetical protein KAR45_20310 [Desulfobacteraceae bacterium]|nr:hypothetical protein [Desulfobacteraceae bacterium]